MNEEKATEAVTDALSNIPGIGPARKAALYAAGITTREALAQASVEQIIRLTGMPRAQAEKALEALRTTESPAFSAPSPQIAPPLTDEAMPAAPIPVPAGDPHTEAPVLPDEDQDPATEARGLLDNATFRARTALSDATRVWDLPRLTKSLERLAGVLDTVTEKATEELRPKAAKRLTGQLTSFATWIEKSLAGDKPLSEKRRDQLRDRLKSERAEIEAEIQAAVQRQNGKKKTLSKDVSREPKRQSKRIKR